MAAVNPTVQRPKPLTRMRARVACEIISQEMHGGECYTCPLFYLVQIGLNVIVVTAIVGTTNNCQ